MDHRTSHCGTNRIMERSGMKFTKFIKLIFPIDRTDVDRIMRIYSHFKRRKYNLERSDEMYMVHWYYILLKNFIKMKNILINLHLPKMSPCQENTPSMLT